MDGLSVSSVDPLSISTRPSSSCNENVDDGTSSRPFTSCSDEINDSTDDQPSVRPSCSRSSAPKKRRTDNAVDAALYAVVENLKSHQEQKPDACVDFGRYVASKMLILSQEQRDIFENICCEALKQGVRGNLTDDHKLVRIEEAILPY